MTYDHEFDDEFDLDIQLSQEVEEDDTPPQFDSWGTCTTCDNNTGCGTCPWTCGSPTGSPCPC